MLDVSCSREKVLAYFDLYKKVGSMRVKSRIGDSMEKESGRHERC